MIISQILVFLVGLSGILIGWIVFAVELWHLHFQEHSFELAPMAFAAIMMTGGALLIQTGNVRDTIKMIKQLNPLYKTAENRVIERRKRQRKNLN